MPAQFVIKLSCEDRPGPVSAVTSEIARLGGNIREAQQFKAVDSGSFFMCVRFDCEGTDCMAIDAGMAPLIDRYGMDLTVRPPTRGARSC